MTSKHKPADHGTKFKDIFGYFEANKSSLKIIHVASCNRAWKPNSAAKMLVDVIDPNILLYLEYKHTQTYANLREVPMLSVSVMDDTEFHGYRLTGVCTVLDSGEEYETAKERWARRLISYEAERIIQRVKGLHSAREAENALPKDFVIVKLVATEAAVVKPDRVLKAIHAFTTGEK